MSKKESVGEKPCIIITKTSNATQGKNWYKIKILQSCKVQAEL